VPRIEAYCSWGGDGSSRRDVSPRRSEADSFPRGSALRSEGRTSGSTSAPGRQTEPRRRGRVLEPIGAMTFGGRQSTGLPTPTRPVATIYRVSHEDGSTKIDLGRDSVSDVFGSIPLAVEGSEHFEQWREDRGPRSPSTAMTVAHSPSFDGLEPVDRGDDTTRRGRNDLSAAELADRFSAGTSAGRPGTCNSRDSSAQNPEKRRHFP